ncbi:heparan-alpha-glucosaminide N-acetyltransferase domain-containing protein [Cellulomonas telluris]|uniref:heparan-alpha-glucosaminide N-acetyltransferase domain-containing protein n=1 Tax=Cellulomonas telluris TaxID=2306636 RepID=UPI0014562E3A|nr:heparan-alpha-glucosaminide N-acetyltransferase domain-containing protein [Cellulomonas telluris]
MRRIVGVDTARGLAVLGMVAAHVGPDDTWRTVPPGGFAQLADGRPSALFVVLAGVGLALLSGGDRPVTGTRLVQARLRILVRAALLVVLGAALVQLGTPVVVILVVYGGMFAAGTLALRWPRPVLVAASAAVALLGPLLLPLGDGAAIVSERPVDPLTVLLGHYYPAVVWMSYVLTGLAVGRSDLRSGRVHAWLAGVGAALVLAGHGGSAALTAALGRTSELTTSEPHSSSLFEVAGNTGVTLLVLAACLAVGVRWPRALAPVTATGALALTAYTGHLLVIAALGTDVVWAPTTATWLWFTVVVVALCWAWRAWVGRGPLEWVLHAVSTRAADVAPDRLPPRADDDGAALGTGGLPGPADEAAPRQGQTSDRVQEPSPERR